MVVKSFDPRDAPSGRSWTFRALTFAGSVASFLTGVPNFNASNELIAVNEKFGNILVHYNFQGLSHPRIQLPIIPSGGRESASDVHLKDRG